MTLEKNKMSKHGFKPSIILPEHKMLGAINCLPQDIQCRDGQWGLWLPPPTYQNKNNLETEACTIFAPLRAIEILGKKKFGSQFQNQLSARFDAILAGITHDGADPQTSCETIRKYGVVPEVFFSFDVQSTWEQYYTPNPPPPNLLGIGQHWLGKYKFWHEWVCSDTDSLITKQTAMKYALQFSPLTVATFAWSLHSDGKYYKDQPYDDHDVCIYGYVENEYWLAFDSYDEVIKKLDWNTNFDQIKRFHLELNAIGAEQSPWYARLGDIIKNYLGEIIR